MILSTRLCPDLGKSAEHNTLQDCRHPPQVGRVYMVPRTTRYFLNRTCHVHMILAEAARNPKTIKYFKNYFFS